LLDFPATGLRPPTEQAIPHHSVLGMRLDYLSMDGFVGAFMALAESGTSSYCCVPDVHQCMICHENEAHRNLVNGASIVMSDSVIMQTARGLRHGVPAVETVLGSQMMKILCAEAENRSISVALIGGRDDVALEHILSALARDYPTLKIGYAYSPPFRELTDNEEADMLEGISRSGAQIVFIGIGCPKQEQWMGRYNGRIDAAMIGVGAAFDTLSGQVKSSPAYIHRLGLEWLFRLAREPRRLFRRYLGSAPRFVWLMIGDWARARVSRKAA
jgi:N-acetylglucosaminyldiphosphoundecaprenol N-acetyl-beta-D-mannosaminyltransferase